MFTLEEIKEIHSRVKTGADFPQYIKDLSEIDMSYYNFYVIDGHGKYVHNNGEFIESTAIYDNKTIAKNPDSQMLKQIIKNHQNGETDFMTFCQQSAEAGVLLWKTDITNKEVIYLDRDKNKMVVEKIPV